MMPLEVITKTSCQFAYSLLMLWVLGLPCSAVAVSEDYAVRIAQAYELAKKGDDAAASKIYEALIKAEPARPEAYNNLAAIKARRGELKEAQTLLEKAMRSHPSYAAVYDNLSAVYVEMARDSYGKALRLETPQQQLALRELTEVPATKPTSAQVASAPPAKPAAVVAPPAASAVPAPKQATTVIVRAPPATTNTVAPATVNKPAEPAPPAPAAATPALPPAKIDQSAITTVLQGWAAAWSEKAVDLYLVFYADNYAPDGLSHQDWEAQRRQRIQAPKWIQVELSDFQVEAVKEDEARVRLIQQYRADNYQDRTRKEIRLRHTPDGWRIVEESTLAKLD